MAVPVIMPRQGQSVESCIITRWHVKKGDRVKAGDILFTYETDKATFEEEAKEDGVILEIFFEEGADVPVLTNVCVIGEEGEDISVFDPNGAGDPNRNSALEEKAEGEEHASFHLQTQIPVDQNDDRIKISPRARNLAKRQGVDIRYAQATGPEGRIIERDIRRLLEEGRAIATPAAREEYMSLPEANLPVGSGIGGRVTTIDLKKSAAPEPESLKESLYEEVPLSNIRKRIARTMQQSLSNTAQLTLNTSFDASEILRFRKAIKEKGQQLKIENITLNDMILYSVSRVLADYGELNAHLVDDRIRYFKDVHLGVAVDTNRGLMVPTIFHANRKSLNEISREAKHLAEECRRGTINPDFLKGGSFTVTNLGAFGIESFTPILNPPQVGILGVNTVVQRIREVDGKYEYYPSMGLSLTFDHRALDGGPAARFLMDLKKFLESFGLMLAV